MTKKVGLALGGGSALGTAHLGVLQCLKENLIPIDCVAGTSAGAVVAACYAFGVSVEEMRSRAESLSWRSISKLSLSKHGFASNEALADILRTMIGDPNIENAKIPLSIVATNIASGKEMVFREGSVLAAVRASACLPGVFAPVKIGNDYFVDGGLKENVPLSPLTHMDANVKIAVNVAHWLSDELPKNIFDVIDKSIVIMIRRTVPQIEDGIIIEPNLEGYVSSDFTKSAELFERGYQAATLKIPEIKEVMRVHPSSKLFKRFRSWIGNLG